MLKTGRRLESDKFFPLMNVKSQNFLPPIQSVPNVQAVYRSAYSDRERWRARNANEGGGGCLKPLRGQAPVTPKCLKINRVLFSSLYKL